MKNIRSALRKNSLFAWILSLYCVFIFTLSVSGCSDNKKQNESQSSGLVTGDAVESGDSSVSNGSENSHDTEQDADEKTNDLVIPVSSLTTNAQFFGIVVDGTYLEVIAFRSGSSYRTAFNTCQVCYGSSRAYYKQSGSYLVCQNCGNKFALSKVGITASAYTCNPYPILEGDRTVTDDSIIISYEFLVESKNLFKTWKVS